MRLAVVAKNEVARFEGFDGDGPTPALPINGEGDALFHPLTDIGGNAVLTPVDGGIKGSQNPCASPHTGRVENQVAVVGGHQERYLGG
ncbi:MAG: hypothetical protein Q8R28_15735 [Dehalococcoidia bacterium]|nr:hypothetical protein [Dehalococcoidia bacterium]